jgi:HlyD family secretion protein
MQVRTLVDETDMGMLQAGMPADVSVEAYSDQTFAGVIEKIEPQAVNEQNVTMFPVIIALDNSSGMLRPGMNAEVEVFIDEARDVLLVPNVAVVRAEDVGPAAMALGLNPEELDLTAFMQAGGSSGGFDRGGSGQGDFAQRGGGGRRGAGAQSGNVDPELTARMQEMRAQAQSGGISQDSLRAAMQAMRGGSGGNDAMASGNGEGTSTQRVETRPGAVFVIGPTGQPEPRSVQIGLGDWDQTSVTGDIQEGDMLAVVSAAQLQAQQQEWLDRMRGRMGGDNPFGGGMPGGGGFRGGRRGF